MPYIDLQPAGYGIGYSDDAPIAEVIR